MGGGAPEPATENVIDQFIYEPLGTSSEQTALLKMEVRRRRVDLQVGQFMLRYASERYNRTGCAKQRALVRFGCVVDYGEYDLKLAPTTPMPLIY